MTKEEINQKQRERRVLYKKLNAVANTYVGRWFKFGNMVGKVVGYDVKSEMILLLFDYVDVEISSKWYGNHLLISQRWVTFDNVKNGKMVEITNHDEVQSMVIEMNETYISMYRALLKKVNIED